MHVLGLKCFSCGKEFKVDEIKYTCLSCGSNTDVVYDYESIKKTFTVDLLKQNKDFSIWRYFPLLPYRLPLTTYHLPSLPIGWTPLLKARNLEKKFGIRNLYLKDDTKLPSASFKDRASAVVVVKGEELTRDSKSAIVYTTASTGNAGCALACICANLQLPSVIFVPETAPKAKIAQLLVFGAKVIAVRGTYDDAYELSLKATEKFGWYCRSTGYNPYTREGKKTAAYEICEQLNWSVPDKVFVPVGDGNIISGIWKGFRDFYSIGFIDRLPQLVGVQSKLSNAVANAVKRYERIVYSPKTRLTTYDLPLTNIKIEPVKATTIADSISVDMPRDGIAAVKSVIESKGFMVEVTDEEILDAVKIVAQQEGIFAEPSGAASVAGLLRLVKSGKMNTDEKVVCLITGNGLKDIQSAMKVSGEPITISPTIEDLTKVISDERFGISIH